MHALAGLLGVMGGIGGIVAYIWMVYVAFQESVIWGLVVLFFPGIGGLIFAVTHWEDAKQPFLLSVAATVVSILGVALGAVR